MDETRRALRLLLPLGLLVATALITWGVLRLDWSALRTALAQTKAWPWLPLGAAAYLLGQLVRGARGRVLVGDQANVTVPVMSHISAVGYAGNNLLPARLGELARLAMLSERTGFPPAQSLVLIGIERLLDGLVIVGLFALLGPIAQVPRSALFGLVAVAGALVLGIALARFVVPATVALTRGHAIRSAAGIAATLTALRGSRVLFRLLLLSLATWLCEAAMYLALFPALHLPLDARAAVLVMAATNIGLWFAVPAGFIGVFHGACAAAVARVTGDAAAASAYAVLAHAAFYLPVTVWGVGAFTWAALDRGIPLYWRLRSGQAEAPIRVVAPLRAGEEAAPWLVAIVEALVANDLPIADRAQVNRRVAAFAHGQLRALPPLLRAAFSIGMLSFRAVVFVRHGRGLARLSLERRVRVVGDWNQGRARLRRQLFRPLRATALLSFYEQPEVRAQLESVALVQVGKSS
jgi:uncharacterized membrane protein YbhN (UPF0104 family)